MKIIVQGTKPGDIVYRSTCVTCKTEIEYKAHEAERHYDTRDGNYLRISCPTCDGSILQNADRPYRKTEY